MLAKLWEMKRIENLFNRVDQLDERKVLFYIFGISLIIRLAYIIFFPTVIWGDADAYNAMAIGLIEGNGYGGGTSSYWPPGQPFFLAAIYTVFGYNLQIAYIFEALISSLTCIVIYYIGKTVLNKKIGIISSLIAALYPTFIIYSGSLNTETLFIFLFTLSIIGILKIHEDPSAKNILIAGVSFGLAILVRPAILGLIPFILIWMLLSSKDRKRDLIKFIAIFLIAITVVSPWTIRNYNVHHEFVLVSTNGGVNFWIGNNREATGTYKWTNMTNNPIINISDEIKRDRIGYEKGLEFIKENPHIFLILTLKKFAHFWRFELNFFTLYFGECFINPIPKWLFMVLAPLTVLPFIILLPLAIFGIIFYQKWDRKAYLLILLIFYYILIHSIVFASSRYHLQITPYLIIFAAYGICSINRVRSEIKSGDSKTKRKVIIFFLSIAVLIATWYYSTCYWLDTIIFFIKKFLGS